MEEVKRKYRTTPSAPPQDVHLVSLTSTSLKVSWVPPPAASRHGAIVRYSISYQAPVGEDTDRHEVSGVSADATSYVLDNLEKWTEYQVWVRAHTDVGPGPESASVRIKTKEDGAVVSPCTEGELLLAIHHSQTQLSEEPASGLEADEQERKALFRFKWVPTQRPHFHG
ncbi:hypothetical protein CRUP_016168 [Coryphaenoides rupestris]|nr:hypothetical protein CRUP_016168 [Coryphaenoides rupestris]